MQSKALTEHKSLTRRMTSLRASAESFQNFLVNLCKTSALSADERAAVGAILDYLSLMTAGAHVLQYAMDRFNWTSDSTDLLTLKRHWLGALESFEMMTGHLAAPELFEE